MPMFGSMSTPEDHLIESDFNRDDFQRHFFIPDDNVSDNVTGNDGVTDAEQQTDEFVTEPLDLFKISEEMIPGTTNKTYTVSLCNTSLVNGYKILKLSKEDQFRHFMILLLKYIGAAMMISGYTRSRPDLRQMTWGSRLLLVLPPGILGFLFGKYITPIGLVLMMFQKFNRCVKEN